MGDPQSNPERAIHGIAFVRSRLAVARPVDGAFRAALIRSGFLTTEVWLDSPAAAFWLGTVVPP
jgi:hypothetical protein